MKKRMILMLTILFLLFNCYVAKASQSKDKVINLGAINGSVDHEQYVEVIRSLPDPVLFEAYLTEGSDIPNKLIIRNAKASSLNSESIKIWRSQITTMPSGQQMTISAEYSVALLINGKKQTIMYNEQNDTVIISFPTDSKSIILKSDSPVKLRFPKGYRGDISIHLETEGWLISD